MNDPLKIQPVSKPYPEPAFVRFWKEHPGMPRCCYLCRNFANPMCQRYGYEVPSDFAGQLDVCPLWEDEDGIPF